MEWLRNLLRDFALDLSATWDAENEDDVAAATRRVDEFFSTRTDMKDPGKEAELHRCEIERMAEERHLLHSSPGKGDRFWSCSSSPCKRASEYLRGLRPWNCLARRTGTAGGNEPAECDWPFCGCDPAANRVLEALEESGKLK